MDDLLSASDHKDCFVYSEPDDEIILAWRGFALSSELDGISTDSSVEEILSFVLNRDEQRILDPTTCFWCEKSALGCKKLMACVQCRKVQYCGKECQIYDWKGFHRAECKQLAAGKTPEEVGIGGCMSRRGYLSTTGAQRATFPIQISSSPDSVWQGDFLLLYLVALNPQKLALDEKTLGFPLGFHIKSREAYAYEQQR
jgi:hypothetical protein